MSYVIREVKVREMLLLNALTRARVWNIENAYIILLTLLREWSLIPGFYLLIVVLSLTDIFFCLILFDKKRDVK